MPGFNRTGPEGAGPMTGGRRGDCNPEKRGIVSGYSNTDGFGRGMGSGRGYRGRSGLGMGMRRGFRNSIGWEQPLYTQNQSNVLGELKAQTEYVKNTLEAINNRIAELEKTDDLKGD